MNILGIETSCDETSAAVVSDGRLILSNVVASSLKDHQKYGGVIPEIASRRQLEYINIVVGKALDGSRLNYSDIDAVAVTRSPGLIGSLLVGVSFANALSFALGKPLIPVNHIQAHIYANYLVGHGYDASRDRSACLPLPAVGLVVSGGHSSLFYIPDFRTFRLIGETRDDAVGEAYDKVARILDLGYPGGPVIDKLAHTVREPKLRFACAPLAGTSDFSFSGVKTAVLYYSRANSDKPDYSVAEVAAAFQTSVVNAITEKSIEVCKRRKCHSLLIGGGVAANSALRSQLQSRAAKEGIVVSFPDLALCMDNAAMIAGLAFHHYSHR
ncbi:MAG: tRNA (adenosine(37)-N6)-threonylcarbamoyltransferase complex transferase subunit TsaD [Candidatus Omnitrophica bacterium]|nr:tRNA (adenosine(37)-N6)-threonylcarbamoyltransferase complex transferase subunit TsaD [Candidatus Omnitrophota bacterium]